MANAQLPQSYIIQFLKKRNYNSIINHLNYNPRIIETYIDKGVWKDIQPEDFMAHFKHLLSNPFLVWGIAFEKLSNECKYALLILATMGEQVALEDWKMAYTHFCTNTGLGIQLTFDDITWNTVVKLLHDCFVKTHRYKNIIIVTTYNPSVRDFLITYIGQNENIQKVLIQMALFPEQLIHAFSEKESLNFRLTKYLHRNYSAISVNNIKFLTEGFNTFLYNHPTSCKIQWTSEGIRRISFDRAIFVKQFIDCFPTLFNSISRQSREYLIKLITDGNINNFHARIAIIKALDFSQDPVGLTGLLIKLSKEDIPLKEYSPFLDLLRSSNNDNIITEKFIENLEDAMIVDTNSNINNEAEYMQQKETYEEIESKLPDGVSLDRAFEHLEEIGASFPDEIEDSDDDYFRENREIFEAEDEQIDRMMQSLQN
ncbi:hypothetical protein HDR68_02600 [bacterium]|nr:hypothetical protein [bacterium]